MTTETPKRRTETDRRIDALRSEIAAHRAETNRRIDALSSEMVKDQVRTDKRISERWLNADDRISSLRSEFTSISIIVAITLLIIAVTIFTIAMINASG